MVFFNCNACGESLKKNQVEKHYMTKCRKCEVLSCVDCGKEFWGDAFKEHTKCISEEEKYSGKNYKPKANANKGEKKQEQWIEQVQEAIEKAPANNPKLKNLLKQLIDFPNIPRKKAKFENFVRNSVRVREPYLITQAWDALSAGMANQNPSKDTDSTDQKTTSTSSTATKEDATPINGSSADETCEIPKKMSKRERKEERQKEKKKLEKKDKGKDNKEEEVGKKKKKRKHEEVDDLENKAEEASTEETAQKSKKKKKHKKEAPAESSEEEVKPVKKKAKKENGGMSFEVSRLNTTLEVEDATPQKFKLDRVILEILSKAPEKTLSMKKLRKKVQSAFLASGGGDKGNSAEKMVGKLQKKLAKNPQYKVNKEKVQLIES